MAAGLSGLSLGMGAGSTPTATQAAAPPAVPTHTVATFARTAAPTPRVPPEAATIPKA